MLISTGLDIATGAVDKLIEAPKIGYTTYKIAYMGKAITDTNKYVSELEFLYTAYKSSSIVQHEQALNEYIKLTGLEDYLTMSGGLTMTGEKVKEIINSRVSFIDHYITKSKGELDLVNLRKNFEGYYNSEGNFSKGYLQNVEKQSIPTVIKRARAFNNGVYYYECTEEFPERYINESNVYSTFYTKYYTEDGLISSQKSYYDKNSKLIGTNYSNNDDVKGESLE